MTKSKGKWDDPFEKWMYSYLTQSVSEAEKKAVLEIIKPWQNGMDAFAIGQHLNLKLGENLKGDERTQRAFRVGCHLRDEGKVIFRHRDQLWVHSDHLKKK